MNSDIWNPLDVEFATWNTDGLSFPFWWRDDDAVEVTPNLERLLKVSRHVNVPVHLAVIPEYVDLKFGKHVADLSNLIPVTHGFAHKSHTVKPQKKCEYAGDRSYQDVEAEIGAGRKRLLDVFDDQLAPVFVPPWNRFDEKFNTILAKYGYLGISTFTPRLKKWATEGVTQVNAHVDPIEWHGSRSLICPKRIIEHTVASLRDRRIGIADNAEPFGFLTHHLVHDEAIWEFSQEFLKRFTAGPTRIWTAYELGKGQ